jgi:hypothetical protein
MTYQRIITLFYGPCCSTLFKPCVYLGFINHPIPYPIFHFSKKKSLTMPFCYDFNLISCLTQYSRVKILLYVLLIKAMLCFTQTCPNFQDFSYVSLKILSEFKIIPHFSIYHFGIILIPFHTMGSIIQCHETA